MGMFNDFLENTKVVVEKVSEKASDAYDIAKLNCTKSHLSADINKCFKELGNKYYILAKSSKLDEADFSKELQKLDELHAQLENIEKQIDDVKKLKRCTVCGKAQSGDKPFCADCGAKI
ncbi:MAG: hypothetical protein E7513_02010 [Ruminococcaceae bacterium]|nr:hypothetical protein [Oscillospiraceae bacterium]